MVVVDEGTTTKPSRALLYAISTCGVPGENDASMSNKSIYPGQLIFTYSNFIFYVRTKGPNIKYSISSLRIHHP
jgi:hypothetical protein